MGGAAWVLLAASSGQGELTATIQNRYWRPQSVPFRDWHQRHFSWISC